jgi:hypothetical protein
MPELQKMQNTIFPKSKNFQTRHDGRIVQSEQLYFWEGVQIPKIFWIKNIGSKTNLNLVLILKGVQTFEEKSIYLLKFYLDMIFNTAILD